MPVFLSPGVFPREIDLSVLARNDSTIVPAFIGTAQKGPINDPQFITTPEQFLQVFGEPFPESNLGYAVLSFLEEGNGCWVLRVGVECEEGQPAELADVCIDTSGTKIQGWGRIAVFSGIDFGRINLRVPTADAPLAFHDDSVFNIDYTDIDVSSTDGPTVATLAFVGSDLSDTYVGAIDDSFTVLLTGAPTTGVLDGATYEIIRNSDGTTVGSGTLVESSSGISAPVAVGSGDDDSGLIFRVEVTGSSPLEQDDSFNFQVRPNNLSFTVAVEGTAAGPFSFTTGQSYTDPDDFVSAFNTLVGSSVDFIAGYDGTNLFLRTRTAGERIQVTGTEAWALEVGISKWAYDIPRSYLLGVDTGTYLLTSNNNRVAIDMIEADGTTSLEVTVPVSTAATPASVANALHLGGISSGDRYYDAFALQVTDDDYRVVVVANENHQFGQLRMLADFSHIKTLRFAEELNFTVTTRAPRVFTDSRVELPEPGVITPSTPLSCETDPSGADCALDTAYYNNIVGFLVATSPGTWLEGWSVTLQNFANQPGRYALRIFDDAGLEQPDGSVDDISFDPEEERYIGNVLNPGSTIGGVNGNPYLNWEERPIYLDNDPTDTSTYEVRQPGTLNRKALVGMANGIPLDATYSSELDAAIIGNAARASGVFAFQDTDGRFNSVTLLATPGFSSGPVIAAGLQLCEGRGDCLYLIDPPFGLRPQQVVDWHNGMLFSDLATSLNSSYGALYWPWVEIFDQFNGGTIFVPPSGAVSAVYARTAREAEPWFAPAGLNRGRLLTVLDLEMSPTAGERDLLYGFNNAVNPLVNFAQDGVTVFGQRTLQRKDSALDRVNVRMLLIFLKKALVPLLRNFIFEPNDRFLWAQVKNTIEPFLADVQGRRGITAFKVIVDETNNTPERIDRNELWVTILIKPTRAVEFVVLNLAVLRTDASFAAEELLAAAGVVVAQ
jgi:hypothetical protein